MDALRRGHAIHAIATELAACGPTATATALRARAESILEAKAETVGDRLNMMLTHNTSTSIDLTLLPLSSLISIHKLCTGFASDADASLSPPPTTIRAISYDALARSRTTLADFSSFYFGYHGLSRADDFFRWLPQLVFTEACIYQLDEDNEHACLADPSTFCEGAASSGSTRAALRGVLASRGLLASAESSLADGERYWALERKLCGQMRACEPVCLQEVYECSGLKSFDYRCLHALLCALSGKQASEPLLRFLHVDEMLTDMADDLFDYEKDVRQNSFNVLRGCVHALGVVEAPLALAAKIGSMEKEHASLLAALPQDVRDAYCASRAAAMRVPGSEKWVFPPVVSPQEEGRIRDASAKAARTAKHRRSGSGEAVGDVESESEVESDAEPLAKRQGTAAR